MSSSATEKTGEQNQNSNTSKRNPLQNVDVNSPKRIPKPAKQSVQKALAIHISPLRSVPAPSSTSSQERKESSDKSRPVSKGKFEVLSVRQNSSHSLSKKENKSVRQQGNSKGSPTWYQEPTEGSIKILEEFAKELLLSGHGHEEVRFVFVGSDMHSCHVVS